MNPQIQEFKTVVAQYRAGMITDDQVEELYGIDTLCRILDSWQEQCYAHYYA